MAHCFYSDVNLVLQRWFINSCFASFMGVPKFLVFSHLTQLSGTWLDTKSKGCATFVRMKSATMPGWSRHISLVWCYPQNTKLHCILPTPHWKSIVLRKTIGRSPCIIVKRSIWMANRKKVEGQRALTETTWPTCSIEIMFLYFLWALWHWPQRD